MTKHIECPKCGEYEAECMKTGGFTEWPPKWEPREHYDSEEERREHLLSGLRPAMQFTTYRIECSNCGYNEEKHIHSGEPFGVIWITKCPFCGVDDYEHSYRFS